MPAAAISAATGIGKAIIGSNAANQAAKAQQAASQANIGFQNQVLGNVQGDVQPIIGAGNQSANALSGLLGIGGDPQASQAAFGNFLSSTPYQFLLNQGLQGQAFANAPNLQSGATAKALGNYAQGMAGNAIWPYMNLLQGQEGLGLQGSNIYAQTGANIAQQEANARNMAAGAQGWANMYGAGQFSNALQGISNLASSSFGNGNPFANLFGGGGMASTGAANAATASGTWGLG